MLCTNKNHILKYVMNNKNCPIRILVVDDQELVRLGLRLLLKDVSDIKIVGEVASGEEAIELSKVLFPDVILMDIKMPGIGGLEATKRIVGANPDSKILILTICKEKLYLSRALEDGATGYITKDAGASEILQAIRVVYSKRRYVGTKIVQRDIFNRIEEQKNPFGDLSNRELQIAIMIAKACSTSEISQYLNLGIKTINSYCFRIFKKLNIKGRVALVRLVMQHNLLDEMD